MTDNTERTQVGWGFWLLWTLVTAVSAAVGFGVGGFINAILSLGLASCIVWPAVLTGASLGIAQGLVLRPHLREAGRWASASTVGFVVGFIAAVLTIGPGEEALVAAGFAVEEGFAVLGATVGAVIGASLGIAQGLVLWRRIPGPGWWVLASTASLAVGVAVGFAVAFSRFEAFKHFYTYPVTFSIFRDVWENLIVVVPLAVAIYGAITGVVLLWLLRQPVTEEPSPPQDPA